MGMWKTHNFEAGGNKREELRYRVLDRNAKGHFISTIKTTTSHIAQPSLARIAARIRHRCADGTWRSMHVAARGHKNY